MRASTVLLYAATVLVWGSTWIMMKFQLGQVAPAASLTYRYFLADCVVLIGAWIAGKVVRLAPRQHLWCALQGALMFSVNYWLTYLAAAYLTTGVVSVFFAGVSGEVRRALALNDVVVQRGAHQGMLTCALRVGDDWVTNYR